MCDAVQLVSLPEAAEAVNLGWQGDRRYVGVVEELPHSGLLKAWDMISLDYFF